MKSTDWTKLCKNIYEKKCVLLIGPEFPLEDSNGKTTFSEIITAKLKEELTNHPRVPDTIKRTLQQKEISQLAGDYIKYTDVTRSSSRENLGVLLFDLLLGLENTLISNPFIELSALPFTFIVNTNYNTIFYKLLEKGGKNPQKAYYNFRGEQIDLIKSSYSPSASLGSEAAPFIYNLFGSIENIDSLVLSENELIEFVINIISKSPGLPSNVKSELTDKDSYFLFLGFGIVAKNWYFRILLQANSSVISLG